MGMSSPSLYLGLCDAMDMSFGDFACECLTEHMTFVNFLAFPMIHFMTYGGAMVNHCTYNVYWCHVRCVVMVHPIPMHHVT
jgi:hypothetical protein